LIREKTDPRHILASPFSRPSVSPLRQKITLKTMPFAIAIMGPTASGKTDVAESLAERFDAAIVNADAFQVYKGLDIGTAKPKNKDRYELLDILEPWEPFSVGKFLEMARPLCVRFAEEGKHCIVTGGTGLYIRALFEEYEEIRTPPDPELRKSLRKALEEMGPEKLAEREGISIEGLSKSFIKNPAHFLRYIERKKTPKISSPKREWKAEKRKFGLEVAREILRERITQRVHRMLEAGWLEEVRTLSEMGANPSWPAMRAHGYKELLKVIQKKMSLEEAIKSIITQISQYAKRQMTWLRKEPNLIWINAEGTVEEICNRIENAL